MIKLPISSRNWKDYALGVSGGVICILIGLLIGLGKIGIEKVDAMNEEIYELKTHYSVMANELTHFNKELERFNDQFEQLILIQSQWESEYREMLKGRRK